MRRHWPTALCFAGLLLHAAAGPADFAAMDNPAAIVPGASAPPARAAPAGGVEFVLPFAAGPDRVYWDIPLGSFPGAATVIVLDFTCPDPAATRALTLHLRIGHEWLSAQKSIETAGRQTLVFRRADFAGEGAGGNPDWRQAETLRFSLWRGAARDAVLSLHAIRAEAASVAVVAGTGPFTAPGEGGLARQCADRALRLLDRAGLPADLVSDELERLDLRPYRLLVLPYNPALSPRQAAVLARFVKRRQGRLAVFYLSHDRLAAALGFKCLPYATQAETWHTVSFDAPSVPGLPASMSHFTQHLLPVRAATPGARNVGRWLDADHNPDRSLPASAVSPRGVWFSHIPPRASPAAVQWFLSALTAADPAYAPARDRFHAAAEARAAQVPGVLAAVPAPADEIRAVWSRPLSPRTRDEILAALAAGGINTLFEQLGTGGYALYQAGGTVPEAAPGKPRARAPFDRMLLSARTNHMELHAWVVCWNLDGLPAERLAELRAEGRLMQAAGGQELPWLCPLHPENRAALRALFSDLVRRGVAGIHLDYIRYPARAGCYCPRHRAAFETHLGRSVAAWPADVLPGGLHAAAFEQVRTADLTAFVAAAARELRALNPALRLSAAVYPTPAAAAENGQDWPAWLRAGALDFACPMLYTADPARFADWLDLCLAAAAPGMILPGIGTGADEAQLDALGAAEQIAAARARRCPGFVFFPLDSDLSDLILPALVRP